MTIFDFVNPTPSDIFYQRNDANDVRLGEVVQTTQEAYDNATVVIIGCPQDEGVHRNKGRIGAAQAPDAIRSKLYKFVAIENDRLTLFDIGNTIIQDTLEDTHARHRQVVRQLILDGKIVVSLGGGNDVSYPDCAGLSDAVESVLAINLDAHFDVRADSIPNSGTPYRQLLEEALIQPHLFYEVGSMPMVNSPHYRNYLIQQNANIIDRSTLKQQGIEHTFKQILSQDAEAIFWGLDMDVVNVADAPGVSAPNSLGISGADFCQIASIAGSDKRSRIFEITEVNPLYDIDGCTARLAATAIYQFLVNHSF